MGHVRGEVGGRKQQRTLWSSSWQRQRLACRRALMQTPSSSRPTHSSRWRTPPSSRRTSSCKPDFPPCAPSLSPPQPLPCPHLPPPCPLLPPPCPLLPAAQTPPCPPCSRLLRQQFSLMSLSSRNKARARCNRPAGVRPPGCRRKT